jgi:hypothetical protein
MGLAAAAVLVLAGASAPPARAAVAFAATVQPSEISFLETRELSYRLRMTTGEREERFRSGSSSRAGTLGLGAGPTAFRSSPTASANRWRSRGRGAWRRPPASMATQGRASASVAAASGS